MFNDNFIKVYDNTLPKRDCEILIKSFESDDRVFQTETNSDEWGTAVKKAHNLCIAFNQVRDRVYNDIIFNGLNRKINSFVRTYPYLGLETTDMWAINTGYNIQKYEDGQGYYSVHCENGRHTPNRILAWMIYLNDAKSGTEFPNYKKVVRPKTGRLVIWPSQWTHTHKGVTPNVGLKYIATGWCGYVPLMEWSESDKFNSETFQNVLSY